MMDIYIHPQLHTVWLSYSYLSKQEIPRDTYMNWTKRNTCNRLYIDNRAFVLYDSIPASTRAKLPSRETLERLYKDSQIDRLTQQYFHEMEYAQNRNFVNHMEIYKKMGVKFDNVSAYAKKHAVWEVILSYYAEEGLIHDLWELHTAYCMLYPKHYVYNSFSNAIKTARENGIENILVKKSGGPRKIKFDAVIDAWIMQALSSGKKYSSPKITKFIEELCQETGRISPSVHTIKKRVKKLKPLVNEGRNGKDDDFYKKLPYQGIQKAENPNDQWQVDGWRLPLYMKGEKGYETRTLFWVLDACADKVIGYHISKTENTETILKGIEDAVSNTGCLPFEILSDNHSMNQTTEAEYFKNAISKLGCTWNVSQNPRRKSLVERSFKTLGEQICKDRYGYIGEGIKTKNPDGLPSQDLIDKYVRKNGWLTEEQIMLIAIEMVDAYNKRVDKDGKTPIIKYKEGNKANCIKVDQLDCLRLFVRESEHTIRRGQINIKRAGVVYEYQLNKEQYLNLNDKKVRVRYSDFDEIYLFDIETDDAIGCVPRKQYAHGALANQTEEDKLKFFKHKGRLNGIQNGIKQRQIDIMERAEAIDPDAAYRMNAKLTPKNVVEEFKQNGELRKRAEKMGIDVSTVPDIPVFCECNVVDLEKERQKKDKRRNQPVMATAEDIANFKMSDYLIED